MDPRSTASAGTVTAAAGCHLSRSHDRAASKRQPRSGRVNNSRIAAGLGGRQRAALGHGERRFRAKPRRRPARPRADAATRTPPTRGVSGLHPRCGPAVAAGVRERRRPLTAVPTAAGAGPTRDRRESSAGRAAGRHRGSRPAETLTGIRFPLGRSRLAARPGSRPAPPYLAAALPAPPCYRAVTKERPRRCRERRRRGAVLPHGRLGRCAPRAGLPRFRPAPRRRPPAPGRAAQRGAARRPPEVPPRLPEVPPRHHGAGVALPQSARRQPRASRSPLPVPVPLSQRFAARLPPAEPQLVPLSGAQPRRASRLRAPRAPPRQGLARVLREGEGGDPAAEASTAREPGTGRGCGLSLPNGTYCCRLAAVVGAETPVCRGGLCPLGRWVGLVFNSFSQAAVGSRTCPQV